MLLMLQKFERISFHKVRMELENQKPHQDNTGWVSPAHLPQHIILLYTVDLARADFSFEGVLEELPTDIH